jgi:hypothetical protein
MRLGGLFDGMEKIIRDSFFPSNRTVGIGIVLPFYDFSLRFSILLIPPFGKGRLGSAMTHLSRGWRATGGRASSHLSENRI